MRSLATYFLVLCYVSCIEQKLPSEEKERQVLKSMDSVVSQRLREEKYSSALGYLDTILPSVMSQNNPRLLGAYYIHYGIIYFNQEILDSAAKYYSKAYNILENDSASKYMARYKAAFGRMLTYQEKYDSAITQTLKAKELAERYDTLLLPEIYRDLSLLYSYLGDEINQRKYLFAGYNKWPTHYLFYSFANNLANYYIDKNDIDSALYYFGHSLVDTASESSYEKATIHENLGVLFVLNGEIKKGLEHLLQSVELYKKINQADGQIYSSVAEAYYRLNDYTRSELYLDSAFVLTTEEEPELLGKIYNRRARNRIKQDDYQAAFQLLDTAFRFHLRSDSTSFLNQVHEIETRYEVKAKDQQINQLALTNEMNEYIRKQQNQIIIAIAIAVMLALIVLLLFWRRKRMSLRIKEFELQQKALRSQMSTHFLFNSFFILEEFVETEEKTRAINYLTKLGKITRLMLENAREGFVYLRKEIEILELYLSLYTVHLNGRLSYEISVYDKYEEDDILIPPMLLQPFVENALQHGFNRQANGSVSLVIEKRNSTLLCIIEDNGSGLEEMPNQKKRSLATVITQERLQVLQSQLGRPASLEIIDKKQSGGQGLKVVLTIPFIVDHQ